MERVTPKTPGRTLYTFAVFFEVLWAAENTLVIFRKEQTTLLVGKVD
jgi:hypothetical protein